MDEKTIMDEFWRFAFHIWVIFSVLVAGQMGLEGDVNMVELAGWGLLTGLMGWAAYRHGRGWNPRRVPLVHRDNER